MEHGDQSFTGNRTQNLVLQKKNWQYRAYYCGPRIVVYTQMVTWSLTNLGFQLWHSKKSKENATVFSIDRPEVNKVLYLPISSKISLPTGFSTSENDNFLKIKFKWKQILQIYSTDPQVFDLFQWIKTRLTRSKRFGSKTKRLKEKKSRSNLLTPD